MPHTLHNWNSDDGLCFHAQCWQPDARPKAVVCLAHGLGEHSGRYAHLGAFLGHHGYALFAFDLRGHGQTDGQRGHTPDPNALMDDVSYALAEAASAFPSCPVFLYGHSLGGVLVLDYVLRRRPTLAGVIASSPALQLATKPSPAKLAAARVMDRLLPTFSLSNGLDRSGLSRDPAVVHAYNTDPLVHDRISARLGMYLLASGEWALAHAAEFTLPLLLTCGSADRITSADGVRAFAAKAGPDCTLKIWDGMFHETHNEPQKDQVFAYLLQWLGAHA